MKNRKALIIVLSIAIITTISISVTGYFFKYSIFNDLKTRIYGTRLLDANKSAYFSKWQQGDPMYLYNSTERQTEIVNGNTVTPTVLLFTNLLNRLPLRSVATVWYLLSYLFFFGCILFLLSKVLKQQSNSNIFLIACASLFCLVAGWRMHCLSGQMYILYAFMGIAAYYFYSKDKMILAALFAGLLTAARLPALLLFAPLFLFKKNSTFLWYYGLSFAATFLVTILAYGTHVWQDYFAAMHYYELENIGAIPEIRKAIEVTVPSQMEGLPTIANPVLSNYVNWINADIFSIQKLLIKLHLPSSSGILYSLFLVYSIGLFVIINRFNARFYLNQKLLTLFCAVLLFSSDYFLPALRFNYNFVLFLMVIAIILFFNLRMGIAAKALMLVGIGLNLIKLNFIPDAYSVGEIFCILAALITIVNNRTLVTDEVFEYNWIAKRITSYLGLYPKVGLYRNAR
jgi:hypothetical protein